MEANKLPKLRNPLWIPEILENILKFLPIQDILKCRQVNRMWKHASNPTLLGLPKKDIKFTDLIFFDQNMDKLVQFVSVMTNAEMIPVNTFEILLYKSTLLNVIIQNFFEVCGASVKYLDVKCKEDNLNSQIMWSKFLLKLPNLEKLRLRTESNLIPICNSYITPRNINNESYRLLHLKSLVYDCDDLNLLNDILNVSPVLNSLSLKCTSHVLFLTEADECHRKKLKSIFFTENSIFVDHSKFFKLMNTEFNIHTLDLGECEMSVHHAADTLLKYIRSQTETLKILVLPRIATQNIGEALNPIQFPPMANLQRLAFRCKWERAILVTSWTQQYPKLKCLETDKLFYDVPFIDNIFPRIDAKMPSTVLTKLSIPFCVSDPQFLVQMSITFPAVEDLYIPKPIPVAALKPLWGLWPKLKKLRLVILSDGFLGDSPTDRFNSLVMGIDYEVYNTNGLMGGKDVDIDYLSSLSTLPSLCSLKELETLYIEGPLFDSAAKSAILRLENLKVLRIYESHVTRPCALDMIAKLPKLKEWCFKNFSSGRDKCIHISSMKNDYCF